MTRAMTVGLMLMGVAAAATSVMAQAPAAGQGGARGRGPGPAPCMTLGCDVQADWERTRGLVVGLADAMPEDKFGYKTTPAQRSYAEQVMHIVQTDVLLLGSIGAKTPVPTLNPKATSKADVMAALRQSYDFGTAVIKEFDDAQLNERVKSLPFLGPLTSRLRVIYGSMQHSNDIYGQMVVYVRLNGITPPASNRGI